MPELIRVLFGGLLPLVCSLALGSRITRKLEIPSALRFAAGAVLLSLAICFLLLAGYLNRFTLLSVAAVCLFAGLSGRKPWLPAPPAPSFIWILVVPYAILYLVHTLAPEIQPDGMTYHLGLVREWVRTGSFSPRVSYYEILPQGLETLFAMAYAFGGHSAAKLVHFGFLIATVPLLVATGRELGFDSRPAAAFYCFAPVVGITGTAAYNDAALAFFVLATFYCVLLVHRTSSRPAAALAGLFAGACYAVKLPGLLFIPVAVGCVLLNARRRLAWITLGTACLVAAPWMVRATVMTGNPAAPFLNRWFPNPNFHIQTEEDLTRQLRTYNVSLSELPLEVTLRGLRTSGLTGPLFLLAPLGLLALRMRAGRFLWIAAGIAAIPWYLNVGTRFLMPAMLFVALALALALPRKLAWALAVAHAIVSWPLAVDLYVPAKAWHLKGFPWQAALRIQSETEYLHSEVYEYRLAELISAHTKAGDRILDLVGATSAYFDATAQSPWHSAAADRAAKALELASFLDRGVTHNLEALWQPQMLSAIRFRQLEDSDAVWSIQEATLLDGEVAVFPSRTWKLFAEPNPWEMHLAFDRNVASRWSTWQPRRAGMFFEVDFPAPRRLTGVRLLCFRPENAVRVAFEGRLNNQEWRTLASPQVQDALDLNNRLEAGRYLRREGFRFLLAPVSNQGAGFLGRELVDHAGDWGLQTLGYEGSAFLLKTARN